jgi:hypothetical protein
MPPNRLRKMEAARLELIAVNGSTPTRISRGTLTAPHPAAEIPMTEPETSPTKAIVGSEAITSYFLLKAATRFGIPGRPPASLYL